MNERIQQLFWKAGGKTSVRNLMSNPVQIVETNELWDDHIEKFAELIVRECMNICEQQRMKILNNPSDPSWTEHLADCKTIMEQTFLRD